MTKGVYCTPEDIQNWLDVSGRSSSIIEAAIDGAKEYIDEQTEDQFTPEDAVIKTFDGNGKKLLLVVPSLREVTKIETIDEITGSSEILTLDDYYWARGWVKMRGNYAHWPVGMKNVKITGNWGWASVPARIRLLAAQVAALLLGTSKDGVKSESLGSYSVTYTDAEGTGTMTVEDLLGQFKLHKVIIGSPRRRPRVLQSIYSDQEESARLHDPNAWEG